MELLSTPNTLLRNLPIVIIAFLVLILGGIFTPLNTHAQTAAPNGSEPSSYYALPTCPAVITGTSKGQATACTYADGTQTSCVYNGSNYTCTNPDKSISTCAPPDPTAFSANVTCTVTAASGAAAGAQTAAVPQAQLTAAAQTAASNSAGKCNLLDFGSWGNCVTGALATVALAFAGFIGFLLGIVGSIFNWIVVITVFQFGAYFGNSAGLLTAWGIMRDIGNILLLFGFIFMGILMILDLHTIDTRKAIPQLIIVAVLLNFSLFAAEAVVDLSDVLSAALYNQAGAAGQNGSNCGASADPTTCATNVGISGLIMNATGLNDVFSSGAGFGTALSKIGTDPTHQMIVYIGLCIFMGITMVVLLAAAIMLIIRAVVLVFVLVLAPLGFAAMVIPPLAGLGKQWRDMLISQAFFAPVYLLLLLVSLKIMMAMKTAFTSNGNAGTIIDALSTPSTTYGTIFIFFALIIGFMIAAMMSAKKMGAIGADFATSVAQKTVRRTISAPVRMAGAPLYRNTIARGAESLSKLQKSPGLIGGVARGLNVATSGGLQSGLAKVQNTKFMGEQSRTERKALVEHTKHDAHTAHLKSDALKGLKKNASQAEQDAMRTALNKMSDDEAIEFIKGLKPEDAEKTGSAFSTARFKKITENKDIGNAKAHMVKGRFAPARSAVASGDAAKIKDAIKDYTAKEWELAAQNDQEFFAKALEAEDAEGLSFIKESILEDLNKGDALNGSQNTKVRGAKRTSKLDGIADKLVAGTAGAAEIAKAQKILAKTDKLGKAKTSTILELSKNASLRKQQIESIVSENEMTDGAEIKNMLDNIQARHDSLKGTPGYDPSEFNRIAAYMKKSGAPANFFSGQKDLTP